MPILQLIQFGDIHLPLISAANYRAGCFPPLPGTSTPLPAWPLVTRYLSPLGTHTRSDGLLPITHDNTVGIKYDMILRGRGFFRCYCCYSCLPSAIELLLEVNRFFTTRLEPPYSYHTHNLQTLSGDLSEVMSSCCPHTHTRATRRATGFSFTLHFCTQIALVSAATF